jgi:beta-phosphoglucomutase
MFDFNGTVSDDEPVLFAIFSELFAAHGRPLSEVVY